MTSRVTTRSVLIRPLRPRRIPTRALQEPGASCGDYLAIRLHPADRRQTGGDHDSDLREPCTTARTREGPRPRSIGSAWPTARIAWLCTQLCAVTSASVSQTARSLDRDEVDAVDVGGDAVVWSQVWWRASTSLAWAEIARWPVTCERGWFSGCGTQLTAQMLGRRFVGFIYVYLEDT